MVEGLQIYRKMIHGPHSCEGRRFHLLGTLGDFSVLKVGDGFFRTPLALSCVFSRSISEVGIR